MIDLDLDRRPLIVALAGPNGAGKSTFYESHLRPAGLRFVNADVLARSLGLDAYAAADLAAALRQRLVKRRESFVFETVFSDPEGAKVHELVAARAAGYEILLCFIALDRPATSEQRVAMRVTQGGHDVPTSKLMDRFPRTYANLRRAIDAGLTVRVHDNSDMATPFRLRAVFREGRRVDSGADLPAWLLTLMG